MGLVEAEAHTINHAVDWGSHSCDFYPTHITCGWANKISTALINRELSTYKEACLVNNCLDLLTHNHPTMFADEYITELCYGTTLMN